MYIDSTIVTVTLGCLAASIAQPGHHGVWQPSQTISMIQDVVESWLTQRIRHCRKVAIQLLIESAKYPRRVLRNIKSESMNREYRGSEHPTS